MGWGIAAVGAAAFLTCAFASTGHAAVSEWIDVTAVEERLLGDADEAAHDKALLAFTRQVSTHGTVTGTLADSLDVAGVPGSTTLEALRALGSALDLDRDIHTGDRFHLRHEQAFTLAGHRIGVGRVLWLEVVTTAKGTVAIHRFQPKGGIEQFWLANGQAAAPPAFRQPLDTMTLTSGFGLRPDPLDHPSSNVTPPVVEVVVAPPPSPPAPPEEIEASLQKLRAASRAYAGFDTASVASARDGGGLNAIDLDRVMATARRMRALEAEKHRREEAVAAAKAAAVAPPKVEAPAPAEPVKRRLFMHEGLDLLANTGTPIHAAADGVVLAAGPNGGYGNFIRLGHAEKLTTIYGHLSRLAPDLQVGQPVLRGEVIGFVGNTGRSTGAHLHYEIQSNGRPVDPASHPATRCAQLAGADLASFKKQVAASLREREREVATP
jgi:murein DD-endopeptidase MepM/ murein hydrolase activator NlpD